MEKETGRNQKKAIVLIDNPADVQAAHDVYIYTRWDEESIRDGLTGKEKLFFLLTNFRELTAEQARVVYGELARTIRRAAKSLGQEYLLVHGSDSDQGKGRQFVKAFGELIGQPFLTGKQLLSDSSENGGLIIVGSYSQRTTEQLEHLQELSGVKAVLFDSDLADQPVYLMQEAKRVSATAGQWLCSGKNVVVYTKRKLYYKEGDDEKVVKLRTVRITNAIQSVVEGLTVCPSYLIAKGSDTSADIGIGPLHIQKAKVMGQVQPGVPVWKLGKESKFPGLPYIIFPGSTGTPETLKQTVEILMS